KIADNFGFSFASSRNLGSTWYSTPDQIRFVSYLTLFGMSYLSIEEFSHYERFLGNLLWPDWHFESLSFYGQNIIMNHLIKTKQLNIINLKDYLDFPSDSKTNIDEIIQIHVGDEKDVFSKFQFKEGKYDNFTTNVEYPENVKNYSLRMALESKRMSYEELNKLFLIISERKE
ncbi:unnamed protein product, partial [Brachionus calyciflorus]